MIVDVNVILLIEKKKKKFKKKQIGCNHKQGDHRGISDPKRDLGEVVEASSILSEIGGKHVEIPSEVITKILIPTQLVENNGM
jgi:hypothetical protein